MFYSLTQQAFPEPSLHPGGGRGARGALDCHSCRVFSSQPSSPPTPTMLLKLSDSTVKRKGLKVREPKQGDKTISRNRSVIGFITESIIYIFASK